jgi:nucleoside 2-deoxyribosyltransferase
MRIKISLNSLHKLVLRILIETGEISYVALERVVDAIQYADTDFSKFIKCVAGKEGYAQNNFYNLVHHNHSFSELEKTIESLISMGLIEKPGRTGISDKNGYEMFIPYKTLYEIKTLVLTKEGIRAGKSITGNRRLIPRLNPEKQTTIFIACAFGKKDIDALYEDHFFPICQEVGYKPIRVDLTEPATTITESIIEGITDCACIIADLTYARQSVYYEVGFAGGLSVPIVLTCRRDHLNNKEDDRRVHFDLQQFKISFWEKKGKGEFTWSRNMKPNKRIRDLFAQ